MIECIQLLRNVGLFDNHSPQQQTAFAPFTLICGENARGMNWPLFRPDTLAGPGRLKDSLIVGLAFEPARAVERRCEAASGLLESPGRGDLGTHPGLKPCFTPVKSPQANGMSEAFVKTLKHDYVRVNLLPDAQTGLSLHGAWIEDYNENHPHSGLKMSEPVHRRAARR